MRVWKALLYLGTMLAVGGCLSPITIERAGLEYDRAVSTVVVEQLLLNIARARYHHPVHFTVVSSVAATFDFRANAGGTPRLTGETGPLLLPIFGGTVAENPTVSIIPVEGEEFTKRLLTPLDEPKVHFLLRQGVDPALLLRLLAKEFRTAGPYGEKVISNTPTRPAEYEQFRRILLHLSALHEARQLYADPMVFERTWELRLNSAETFQALEKGYHIVPTGQENVYLLRRKLTGRVVLTNYDPDILSNEVRYHLHLEANKWPPNELLVDIRPGYPGGEFPLHGNFRIRSFNAVLNFLAAGIAEELEYPVDPDPRTGKVRFNPAKTVDIVESPSVPENAAFSVKYLGHYYALVGRSQAETAATRWNLEGFRILYQLFNMTVTDVPKLAVPITIAK